MFCKQNYINNYITSEDASFNLTRHNNRCPEMLAVVRRGPFSVPTQEERIEFLLTRMRRSSCSVEFAQHALEHTLSFQRRVHAIKVDISI